MHCCPTRINSQLFLEMNRSAHAYVVGGSMELLTEMHLVLREKYLSVAGLKRRLKRSGGHGRDAGPDEVVPTLG